MKILLVTSEDPQNIASWSGTTKNIYFALQKCTNKLDKFYSKPSFLRPLSRILTILTRRTVNLYKTKQYSKFLAKKVQKAIKKSNPDIIIGIAASVELAYVNTEIPIIHISDATYKNLYNYHPSHLATWEWTVRNANLIEQKVLDNSDIVILPSSWARQSAINDYNCSPNKVKQIPFGANLTVQFEQFKKATVGLKEPCKLLFIGSDWKFKGGDIAFNTMLTLRARGIDATLQIIGCLPPAHISSPYLHVKPHLNKDDENDYNAFIGHFKDSTFFFLPTIADAFGIVFAESAMFGLPSISHKTGGVGSAIEHGKTGFLLPVGSSADDFATAIETLIADDTRYQELSANSLAKYRDQLNWQAWQRNIEEIISECLNS